MQFHRRYTDQIHLCRKILKRLQKLHLGDLLLHRNCLAGTGSLRCLLDADVTIQVTQHQFNELDGVLDLLLGVVSIRLNHLGVLRHQNFLHLVQFLRPNFGNHADVMRQHILLGDLIHRTKGMFRW